MKLTRFLSPAEYEALTEDALARGYWRDDPRILTPGMGWFEPWYWDPERCAAAGITAATGSEASYQMARAAGFHLYGHHLLSEHYWRDWASKRPPIAIMGPGGQIWEIDRKSSNGTGWTVSGEWPNLTCSPSIVLDTYHGYLQNGVFGPDLDGGRPMNKLRQFDPPNIVRARGISRVIDTNKWRWSGGAPYRTELAPGTYSLQRGPDGQVESIEFVCPHGCGRMSRIPVQAKQGSIAWEWNGDPYEPSLSPSIRRIPRDGADCAFHGFLKGGKWEICSDSRCGGAPLKFEEDSDTAEASASAASAGRADSGPEAGAPKENPMDDAPADTTVTLTIGQRLGACFSTLFKAQLGQTLTQSELQEVDDHITALKSTEDAQFAAVNQQLGALPDFSTFALKTDLPDTTALTTSLSDLTDRTTALETSLNGLESDLGNLASELEALTSGSTSSGSSGTDSQGSGGIVEGGTQIGSGGAAGPVAPVAVVSTDPAHSSDPSAPVSIITQAADGTVQSTPVVSGDVGSGTVSVDSTTGVPTVTAPDGTDAPVLGVTAPAPDGTPAPADPAHQDSATSTIVG